MRKQNLRVALLAALLAGVLGMQHARAGEETCQEACTFDYAACRQPAAERRKFCLESTPWPHDQCFDTYNEEHGVCLDAWSQCLWACPQ